MSFPYLSDLVYFMTGYRVFLPLATFGIFLALAMLAGSACLGHELRRLHSNGRIGTATKPVRKNSGPQGAVQVPPQTAVGDFAFVVLVAGVIGARLFHILEHGEQFLSDPISMTFSRSGLSVFGGLIFGAVAGQYFWRSARCTRRLPYPCI